MANEQRERVKENEAIKSMDKPSFSEQVQGFLNVWPMLSLEGPYAL